VCPFCDKKLLLITHFSVDFLNYAQPFILLKRLKLLYILLQFVLFINKVETQVIILNI
jgi:hypothetical protein